MGTARSPVAPPKYGVSKGTINPRATGKPSGDLPSLPADLNLSLLQFVEPPEAATISSMQIEDPSILYAKG